MKDPRLCVSFDGSSFSVRYQDMNALEAAECLRRLATYLRILEDGSFPAVLPAGLDDIRFFPGLEGDQKKICLAKHPEENLIQVSLTGFDLFSGALMADMIATYLQHVWLFGEDNHGSAPN